MMGDPHPSLAEVARSTGFANQHHLARVFRRITELHQATTAGRCNNQLAKKGEHLPEEKRGS